MKKFNLKRPWKKGNKAGFYFYLILFTMLVVVISSSLSSIVMDILNKYYEVPLLYVNIGLSFVVGLILAFFIGKILISPIRKLKNMMNQVAEGNFNVKAPEDSIFDEVDDMYHYFNMMMEELRATEIIQSDFVSNVSHEFKTPINAIEGYTMLLSDPNISKEEKDQYVKKIHKNTARMNQLINNVLLLSKLENQSIEPKITVFSMDEQIRQVIIDLEPRWTEKNVEFDIDMDEVTISGNEGIMFHLWSNIIGNAIKFGPENGVIKISLKKEDGNIIFICDDEGEGIEEESKKFIFNKFYQTDTSHKSEGNGLGLALVKKVVDIYKGKIEVESLIPKGTRFKIIIPNHK